MSTQVIQNLNLLKHFRNEYKKWVYFPRSVLLVSLTISLTIFIFIAECVRTLFLRNVLICTANSMKSKMHCNAREQATAVISHAIWG